MGKCYDCSESCADTVCDSCLELADDSEYEHDLCHELHGERCDCWKESTASKQYEARKAKKGEAA